MSAGARTRSRQAKPPVYYESSDSSEEENSADPSAAAGEPHSSPQSEPIFHIQQIFGLKEGDPSNEIYFVKWSNKSYIHCSWLPVDDVLSTPGGESALKKFKRRSSDEELSSSSSIPSLLTIASEELNSNWFQVDRVIAFENGQYLVKWKSLPYDQASWENEADIPDKGAVGRMHARRQRSNPTVIDGSIRALDRRCFEPIVDAIHDSFGNTLRHYQLQGVNWLRFCWFCRRNSILADEMGLGKTVQIVATLNDIALRYGITGPFLVLSPLSTLPHWRSEFDHWTNLNAVVYHGSPAARDIIYEYEFPVIGERGSKVPKRVAFDVLITNYETFVTDFAKIQDIEWRYLVLDEGHRLKNHSGKCYQLLQQLRCEHCTLLTGTPIQNNVEELWSLLHFLHPSIFNSLPDFLARFRAIDDVDTLAKLQELIKPFLLRRKKGDVETSIGAKEETIIEVELTRIQKTFYRALLHENAPTLLQQITGGSLPSLLNLMMQLRKVCNHPFLIKGATQNIEAQIAAKLGQDATKEDIELRALIDSSGKMILLDKLLPKLKSDGHKVLIFSQMVKVLDIIEDYLVRKEVVYERIDGSVSETDRESAIERFGRDADTFVFLLCTRAGGVGINLTAADTVIIYDSDWNPQNDVQAQSRCHRIGQKAKVTVCRLVTRGTYEMQMLDRASRKLGLDHALLDGGEMSPSHPMAAREIERLLRCGAYDMARDDDTEIDNFCQEDIEQILERRSKEFTCDGVSSSLFNKAKFDPEQDSLDLNAADFWSHVLPAVDADADKPMSTRRCRQATHQVSPESDISSESDDERVSRKKISPISMRGTIRKLLSLGLGECPYERAILYQAASMCDLAPDDARCIHELLRVSALTDDPPDDIATALSEFTSNLNDVRERRSSIVRRCIFFHRLHPLLRRLQGRIERWPLSESSDPMVDYALLLSVATHGLGEASVSQGPEDAKGLSLKAVEKRIFGLVDALEQVVIDDPGDAELMNPQDWKMVHENLYNRGELNDEEVQSLFLTIAGFGLPRTDDEIDWARVKEKSRLSCVSVEAVAVAGQAIADFAKDLDGATPDIVGRLATYGGRQWQRKLRNSIRDIEKVRTFVSTFRKGDEEHLARARPFDACEWWTPEHDLALLAAISEFGQLVVTTWVVDPERPFRPHIPQTRSRTSRRRLRTSESRAGSAGRRRWARSHSYSRTSSA
jgi:chromodomain-helicase-DNA-binding protein 7